MLLKNKQILIMGIRNKWSIAYGIAKSAYDNGAKLIFTYMGEDNKEKIEELISEFKGSKAYVCNGASEDDVVKSTFEKIKQENGKIDGIRLSTRPDYISEEILTLLKKYNVTAIELGAQSMVDEVLSFNDRGHTSSDVVKASKLIIVA